MTDNEAIPQQQEPEVAFTKKERIDPRGTPYYWIGGPPPSGLAEPGTDFDAVVNKRIAITPIQLDLTARRRSAGTQLA